MEEVRFWAVIENEILPVSGFLDNNLVHFFHSLRQNVDVVEHIPAQLSYKKCKFYRLKSPVSVLEGSEAGDQGDITDFPDVVKQACLQESNRVPIHPGRTKIRNFAEVVSPDHVYLAIDIPDLD